MIKEFFLNNRILATKKSISVILILFGIFFVLSNRDVYYMLQYNQMFDKENRADEFFFLKSKTSQK